MVSGLVEGLHTGAKGQLQDDDEDVIKNAAANAYGGGAHQQCVMCLARAFFLSPGLIF